MRRKPQETISPFQPAAGSREDCEYDPYPVFTDYLWDEEVGSEPLSAEKAYEDLMSRISAVGKPYRGERL